MQIQLAAVTEVAEARAAAAAGVDFAGLHLHPGSPWALDADTARAVRLALGPVMPVGVFRDQPVAEVVALATRLSLTWIQLSGRERPETAVALAGRFSVVRRLTPTELKTVDTRNPARSVAVYLVDGGDDGQEGPWAWHKVHGPTISHRPIWIAGGLDPDTVAGAVTAARPAGVVAGRGVRDAEGRLDPERLARFGAVARETWDHLPPEPT